MLHKLNKTVTLTLSESKLIELIQTNALCGADIATHDPEVKALVKKTCLQNCLHENCSQCANQITCSQTIQLPKNWINTHSNLY